MTPYDFEFLKALLRKKSGLDLPESKTYLLESRLQKVMRDEKLPTLNHLVASLRAGNTTLEKQVVEAMTTNESLFFRDRAPFEALEKVVLPQLMKARAATRRLSIWCAACSSGQEPYSLAMMFEDNHAQWAGWNIQIVATDISSAIIEKAKAGVYSQFEVQRGLPVRQLLKYFTQEKDNNWTLNAAIRQRVQFKTLNLIEDFRGMGQFDIIFCRNVLIYFDLPTRKDVLTRFLPLLPPDGRLVLGAPETVVGITQDFSPEPDVHGFYLPVKNSLGGLRRIA